ncbi:L-aspartate oxidase [Halapricum salinum]|uniref:FAD-dependent oxidoreductase n=1 Tax=Halapricum salinum TaxID=1457250 RepID=A0A4D6HBF3_9EURY|nr:FAD-dependent oxidoreductase [Halapricum salinum]QCC50965.1 FAD-dependent oxidoreductase [Halapricum salinum]
MSDRSSARREIGDRDVEYRRVRALVIGAGAAGARAAIELVEQGVDPADVLVLGKRDHGDAHTTWARGGVNGALGTHDPEDDWTIHAADTLNEGHFLNEPAKVETVAREMPDRLRELDDWGMAFSRTEAGEIDQRYFGAQSFRRTAFAGDHTGESMLETLIEQAQQRSVPYRDQVMITRLLTEDDRVLGAAGYDQDSGEFLLFEAEQVILAAGGYPGIYERHSSRDDENTGDGPALALEAGARLMDMEFVQFHPTGMAVDESDPEWEPWRGRLVTEAVRGEGGRLYNAQGERFMERYSPDQMELDARDVVARAIAQEIREGRGTDNGGAYLDISHRSREFIAERLPRMYERFQSLGVDMAEDPVEVAPTAHYGMGGVLVDDRGETDVEGLFAIGEAMGGVHGANRLGGNSLAETVAFGRVTGESVAKRLQAGAQHHESGRIETLAASHFADLEATTDRDGSDSPDSVMADLRALMWDHAGILRSAERLQEGLDRLQTLRARTADLTTGDRRSRSFAAALEVGFAITVAETVLQGALERRESRGAHYRTDALEPDPQQQETIVADLDTFGGIRLSRRELDDPSPAVQRALDAGYELDYHQLE